MTESEYQIHELADKAGVSVRTIRFYIKEGLLPSPLVRGRYAGYSDNYLERLELIRLLKDQFLPLKEIRTRTQGLSQEEVRAALSTERDLGTIQSAPVDDVNSNQESEGDSRALDYINRLLSRNPGGIREPNRQSINSRLKNRTLLEPKEPGEIYPIQQEVWERVYLAPGLELHIQKPVERDTRSKLDQLIQFTSNLFNL